MTPSLINLAYLAASVLAAYHMRTDDERTGRAYYPRFAELLGCGLTGTVPAGFDGDTFIHLWLGLAHWLEAGYGRQLALPTGSSVRRYLPYPFAHVPLRQVDIERHVPDLRPAGVVVVLTRTPSPLYWCSTTVPSTFSTRTSRSWASQT